MATTEKTDDQMIEEINQMTHIELCRWWRFGPPVNGYITGRPGRALQERLFKHFGGFTPEISKLIGWRNQ